MSMSLTLRALVMLLLAALLSSCAAVIVGGAAAGASAVHDRRSIGTVIDDANIELTAFDSINKDKELARKNNIGIVVHNGVMLLIGEVRNQDLMDRALARTSGIEGVKRVVNEISIEEPTGFGQSARDRWYTLRVKTALFDIVDLREFDPTRVNVTTQNAKVYLMGLVTREESERVVEIARGVPGVERVVKVFEYID